MPAIPSHYAQAQRGAVSLMMALIILVLITGMTLISTEIYTLEQRTAGNELRERQAFDAAMTGYERAMAYVEQNNGPVASPSDPSITPNTDVADAIGVSSTLPDYTNPADRVSVSSGGNYVVEICDPDIITHPLPDDPTEKCTAASYASNEFKRLLIYARGWSDDNTGIRNIVAVLERTPAVANAPGNPLTTKGTAVISGAGDVTNPEGRTTIWSGQSVDFTNANFKTNIQSPSGDIIESSSLNKPGVDVIQNDGNIGNVSGDAFFANFFGTTPTLYEQNFATSVFDAASITNYDVSHGVSGEILWANGNATASGNYTFGTTTDPVILIVDGNFSPGGGGNITVNGLLYVMGDMNANANITVNGAIVVQGNVNVSGSFDVYFDSSLLSALGQVGRAAASPGSWKDWKEW